MARRLRFQYAGASCHVVAHGDVGKAVFRQERSGHQKTLAEAVHRRTFQRSLRPISARITEA